LKLGFCPLSLHTGIELCREIQASNQPERLISEKLDPLSVYQKMRLLTQEKSRNMGNIVSLPETTLGWLLELEVEKYQLILKNLFKGLSSVQCIYVIYQSIFPNDSFLVASN
jgi:hypothetical protein